MARITGDNLRDYPKVAGKLMKLEKIESKDVFDAGCITNSSSFFVSTTTSRISHISCCNTFISLVLFEISSQKKDLEFLVGFEGNDSFNVQRNIESAF